MKDSIENQVRPLDLQPEKSRAGFSPLIREHSVVAKTQASRQRWFRACNSLAGGVSSGLRRSAHPYPLYFRGGSAAMLHDVDGNSYIDYTLAWGPNILGHAPYEVVHAITEVVKNGLTFGAQHDLEYEVAESLTKIIPCGDRVCYANSGTEIVQVALRLARAVTGRTMFLKFEGHYHGWDDTVLVGYHPSLDRIERSKYGSSIEGGGQLPPRTAVVAQWNDIDSVKNAFASHSGAISAIICEPLMCNSGCISPEPGFLEFLREISRQEGALLIFDEVITGFRLGLAGAQGFYGITPDLATYAKAIGGGTALSVLAGKKEFMDLIASGDVVHAGTLNGNPIALAAAKAVLEVLSLNPEKLYADLYRRGEALRDGLTKILRSHHHSVASAGEGPVFNISFLDRQPRNYRDLLGADKQLYSDFVLALLDEGVLALPDGRWYISTAHTDADIEATLAAVERAAN
jgi:glutamate-1-semialdehyde 2,1-aminomutase